MERDFIKELGYRALDNRLKRISDRMLHDTRKFFKHIDLDVEPGWHMVFKLLKKHETLTMVEIANFLDYTHPSMVTVLKKMMTSGYVVSEEDLFDKRKKNIRLTQKSLDLLPDLEQIWECCERAIFNMLDGDLSIIDHLDDLEKSLRISPINERFYKEYKKANK